jgi:hypothetical protein
MVSTVTIRKNRWDLMGCVGGHMADSANPFKDTVGRGCRARLKWIE